MELNNFNDILQMVNNTQKSVMAVAGAEKESVIEAVLDAMHNGIADAILVGNTSDIKDLLKSKGENPSDFNIVQNELGKTAADTAVEIIKEGNANFLLKGSVETSELMRPVIKKENRLRTDRTISHIAFYQLPFYHKVLVTSDGGICAYPDLARKKDIIINAVETLHVLGYECPKVAVLCCKESLDNNMPETVDAALLKEMNINGEISGCYVEGPISYDLALSRERAKIKHYDCPYCGDFDILISPNIHAGNILGKTYEILPGVEMASYVAGAKIPIVLTSRAAPARERLMCIAIAGIIAANKCKD